MFFSFSSQKLKGSECVKSLDSLPLYGSFVEYLTSRHASSTPTNSKSGDGVSNNNEK